MPVHAPGDARINHLFHLNFKLRTRPCSAAGMHRQSFAARPILDLLWVTLEMNWTTVTHIPSQIHAQRDSRHRDTPNVFAANLNLIYSRTLLLMRRLRRRRRRWPTQTEWTATQRHYYSMQGVIMWPTFHTQLRHHWEGDSNSLPSIGSELFIFGPPATRSATHVLLTVPSGGSRGFAAWRGFGYR